MKGCGREGKSSSAICDPDSIVSYNTRDRVDDILYNILTNTTSPCDGENGFKVVFTLMKQVEDINGCYYPKSCNAEKMARGLHDRFGVGKKGCNDGVLFLLAVDDR